MKLFDTLNTLLLNYKWQTPIWMTAKNNCQCSKQANKSLLKKKYQCWEEIKMNGCWKQMSVLPTTKSIIAKQILIVGKCKLMIAKNKHPMQKN